MTSAYTQDFSFTSGNEMDYLLHKIRRQYFLDLNSTADNFYARSRDSRNLMALSQGSLWK